jgi:hypothetical protein
MKKTFSIAIMVALTMGFAANAAEKKNPPKNTKAIEAALKEAGGDHLAEDMKIGKVGPIKVEDTFYHAYCGSLKKAGFRIILFDNQQNYLGYYLSEFEPVDFEAGAVLLDSGESDAEGNPNYHPLRIGKDGPAEQANIDGTPTPFVKNEKAEEKKTAEAAAEKEAEAAENLQPEYREWTINNRGQAVKFTAIYIKQAGNKVFLKEQKRGITKDFPINRLSKEDQEYVKQFK